VKINEIFGSAIKKMAHDAIKAMRAPEDNGEIEGVKKDGKIVPRSKTLAALADATASVKSVKKMSVRPTGIMPSRK